MLKRIQKLVRQNQELLNSNEKLRKAVNELTEKNESMKLQLKEARLEVKPGLMPEVQERAKKYKTGEFHPALSQCNRRIYLAMRIF